MAITVSLTFERFKWIGLMDAINIASKQFRLDTSRNRVKSLHLYAHSSWVDSAIILLSRPYILIYPTDSFETTA
jgi:hypothetical protein